MVKVFLALLFSTMAMAQDAAMKLSGAYSGRYECSQQWHPLKLQVSDLGEGHLSAIFTFSPWLPQRGLHLSEYSYSLTGSYDANAQVTLNPQNWNQSPPDGFVMAGMIGVYDGSKHEFTGRIDNPGCGPFELKQERSAVIANGGGNTPQSAPKVPQPSHVPKASSTQSEQQLPAVSDAAPINTTTQSCNANKLAPPGMVCQTYLGQIVEGVRSAAVSAGMAIGEEGKAIDGRLSAARANFSRTPPNATSFATVAEEFSTALLLKDLWYLSIDLLPIPMMPYPDYVDGGIKTGALDRFNGWSGWVKRVAGRQMGDVNTMSDLLAGPAKDTMPAYDYYRFLRDWIEFAAAGHPVTTEPERFAEYILAMKRPWNDRDPKVDANWPKTVQEYYQSLSKVFGGDVVRHSAKRLIDAPKNASGAIEPPLRVSGGDWSDPYLAFLALLGDSSPHNYASLLSVIPPRRLTAKKGARASGHTLDKAPDFSAAEVTYTNWVTTYGEKKLLIAADQVRTAAKDGFGDLMETQSLGVSQKQPRLALEELLEKNR